VATTPQKAEMMWPGTCDRLAGSGRWLYVIERRPLPGGTFQGVAYQRRPSFQDLTLPATAGLRSSTSELVAGAVLHSDDSDGTWAGATADGDYAGREVAPVMQSDEGQGGTAPRGTPALLTVPRVPSPALAAAGPRVRRD